MATKIHAHIDQISNAERIPATGNYNIPASQTMHRYFTFFGHENTPNGGSASFDVSLPNTTISGQFITIENKSRQYSAFNSVTTLGVGLNIKNNLGETIYALGVDEEKTFVSDGTFTPAFRVVDITATDVGALPVKFTFEPTISLGINPLYLPNRRYSNFNFQWSGVASGQRTIFLPAFGNKDGDILRLNPPSLQIGQTGVVKIPSGGFQPEVTLTTWSGQASPIPLGQENKPIQVKRDEGGINKWALDFTVYEHKSRHAIGGQDPLSPSDIGAAAANQVVHLTGNQTISGEKTFADKALFNSGIEVNPYLDGETTLFVSGDRVGINNENPEYNLDVSGSSYFTEKPLVGGYEVFLGSSDSYIIAVPGDDLLQKYNEAKVLSPGGVSKDAQNRANLLIIPGKYTLTGRLILDENYVDVIGLGAIKLEKGCIPAVNVSGNNILVSGEDIKLKGINCNSTRGISLWPAQPLQIIEDCSSSGDSSFCSEFRLGLTGVLAANFINCSGGGSSFSPSREPRLFSGKAFNCIGGGSSFASDGSSLSQDSVFINCSGLSRCFGAGGTNPQVNGYFKDCIASDSSFGFGFNPGLVGTFENCKAGEYSFGFGASPRISGKFINCSGGEGSFGSINPFIFTEAEFINCTAGFGSFGNSGSALSGKFFNCRLTSGTFSTGIAGRGIMRNCIDGNNNLIDQ